MSARDPVHLFAYGTLMCADIMYEVSGFRRQPIQARLANYRRRVVTGEDYPAIVPEPGCQVDGVVYGGLSPTIWARLDRFEGDMYARETETVVLTEGSRLIVYTYVARPAFLDALDEADWDYAEFLRHGKDRFQAAYRGFGDL